MKLKLEYTFDLSDNDLEALAFYMGVENADRFNMLRYFTHLIEDKFISITRDYARMKKHFQEES